MKRMFKSVGIALAITSVVGITAFANTSDSKGLSTGTVYGSLAGGSGYANASTDFSPKGGYYDQKAYVFIGSVHENGSYLETDQAYGSNNDKYNAWISHRDSRASTWHSSHSSTATDNELWLWITD